MADPTKTSDYYDGRVQDQFLRPLHCRIRATFSNTGATVTVSSTRRQSHKATITGDTGVYDVVGLPFGQDYHVVGVEMNPGTGTKLINMAQVSAFDAAAGTLTFITRQSSDGVPTDPADSTVVFITLDVETGAYT